MKCSSTGTGSLTETEHMNSGSVLSRLRMTIRAIRASCAENGPMTEVDMHASLSPHVRPEHVTDMASLLRELEDAGEVYCQTFNGRRYWMTAAVR